KAIAREPQQPARGHVEQDGTRRVELGERADPMPRLDLAAEGTEVRGERVGDLLRATARERPAAVVAEEPEHEPERGAGRSPERQDRMGGEPGEEAAGLLAAEREPCERRCRKQGACSEPAERERMRGHVQRRENVVEQRLGGTDERCEELPPPVVVAAERRRSRLR